MVLDAHRISDSNNRSFVVKASVDGWVGVSEVAWVTSVFFCKTFLLGLAGGTTICRTCRGNSMGKGVTLSCLEFRTVLCSNCVRLEIPYPRFPVQYPLDISCIALYFYWHVSPTKQNSQGPLTSFHGILYFCSSFIDCGTNGTHRRQS